MKKVIIGSVAALALAGCATTTPAPVVTVTALPEPTESEYTPPPMSKEDQFVAVIEDKYGPLTTNQENRLIDFAKDTCSNFEAFGVNATINQYASEIRSKSEAKLIGYVMGAGTAIFCPRYQDNVVGTTSA
jgi:type IV pilus biogenesis protein CpaD/CtpE